MKRIQIQSVYYRVSSLQDVLEVTRDDIFTRAELYANLGTDKKPEYVKFASKGDSLETNTPQNRISGLIKLIIEGKAFTSEDIENRNAPFNTYDKLINLMRRREDIKLMPLSKDRGDAENNCLQYHLQRFYQDQKKVGEMIASERIAKQKHIKPAMPYIGSGGRKSLGMGRSPGKE